MRLRARQPVHLGARLGLHLVGEEPVARLLRAASREISATLVSLSKIDFLEVVRELEVLERLRLAGERRVPARLAHRLARAHEALEPRVVAQEVRVHVHDELVRERLARARAPSRASRPRRGSRRTAGRRPRSSRRRPPPCRPRSGRSAGGDRPCCLRELVAERLDARLDLASAARVCGSGMNSSLETNWVGMGDANAAVSAGRSCARSSGSIRLIAAVLRGPGRFGWRIGRGRHCGPRPASLSNETAVALYSAPWPCTASPSTT